MEHAHHCKWHRVITKIGNHSFDDDDDDVDDDNGDDVMVIMMTGSRESVIRTGTLISSRF